MYRLRDDCPAHVTAHALKSPIERQRAVDCLETTHEAYRVGEMVVHAGSLIHAVAPWPMSSLWGSAEDVRMTLQGFAFRCGGVWQLHW